MSIVLIGSPEVESVLVQDNQEPLIDLAEHFPELAFDQTRRFVQSSSPSISYGRMGVGVRLVRAQQLLPKGYKFLIKECYRPLAIQKKFWQEYESYLRGKFPNRSEQEIREECSKYVAPVSVAPHSTGGAVDLTLTNLKGDWLEMGSQFNADPSSCEYRTYFDASGISEEARRNRQILKEVMTEVGFVNYPTEWWHWSYGDKYWAHLKQAPCALYSSVELGDSHL